MSTGQKLLAVFVVVWGVLTGVFFHYEILTSTPYTLTDSALFLNSLSWSFLATFVLTLITGVFVVLGDQEES